MSNEFQYDPFLSHSAKDKAVVRPLAERLRHDGLLTDSQPSILNPQPVRGSDWAQLEAGMFRFRDPLNQERPLIPLRLDDRPIVSSLQATLAKRAQSPIMALRGVCPQSVPSIKTTTFGGLPRKAATSSLCLV